MDSGLASNLNDSAPERQVSRAAAGHLSIFVVPAVLVFFGGRETIREARNFGIQELGAKIDRYYEMLFGEGA